jgi:hypothetical protein
MDSEDPRSQLEAMKGCLIDTGPLVASLDASDPERERVAAWLDGFSGQFLITSAVITRVGSPHTGQARERHSAG